MIILLVVYQSNLQDTNYKDKTYILVVLLKNQNHMIKCGILNKMDSEALTKILPSFQT